MELLKGYFLPQDTLHKWNHIFVPDIDLLYFIDKPNFVPVCKIEEVNPNVLTLDNRTSFLTWSVSKQATYVSQISNEQFQKLPPQTQKFIWNEQKRLNRGMVFTIDEFLDLVKGEDRNEVDRSLEILGADSELVAIQGNSWRKLSDQIRIRILFNYAAYWVEEHALPNEVIEPFMQEFPVLSPFMNSFPEANGPNCLAAAAAAATNSTVYMNQWMQTEFFMKLLKKNHYHEVDERSRQSDVIVWFHNKQPVHAAYMLNDDFAFNKHGQTIFNPWQIIRKEELLKAWDTYEYKIYRKT
jgi:hypothetical protein